MKLRSSGRGRGYSAWRGLIESALAFAYVGDWPARLWSLAQVAAPWGPLVLPHGRMCRAYPAGLDRFESGLVYVSRGVGGVEVPIRTFAPPDMLVLELIRPKDPQRQTPQRMTDAALRGTT